MQVFHLKMIKWQPSLHLGDDPELQYYEKGCKLLISISLHTLYNLSQVLNDFALPFWEPLSPLQYYFRIIMTKTTYYIILSAATDLYSIMSP